MEKKHTVGIFSRSDQKDYEWLVKLLTSPECRDWVLEVRSTVISNSMIPFISDVSKCTFGILYHTKNRGGVNISDISGSLYNEEMKILHTLLGKENVLVVIDDLRDSSDEEKRRILKSQPSTEALACDLLLISNEEKKNTKTLLAKLKSLRPFHSTSENVSEDLFCSNAKKCNSDSNYLVLNDKFETWSINENPEPCFAYEISGRQNNTSKTHENIYVPTMCSSPEDEEEHIYDYPDDSFKNMKNFENPQSWDNAAESPPNSSYNESHETCDSTGGHETMDLYVDPEAAGSSETFETLHPVMAPKILPCDEPSMSTVYKEMHAKFASRENSETNASYGNYETTPKAGRPRSRSGCTAPERVCNKKEPKRYSSPQKPYKWFYNETEQTWRRNEDYEMSSNGHKTKTSSTEVPQQRKWNHSAQTGAQTKDKNPERRSISEKTPKWVYNEKDQTWRRN